MILVDVIYIIITLRKKTASNADIPYEHITEQNKTAGQRPAGSVKIDVV